LDNLHTEKMVIMPFFLNSMSSILNPNAKWSMPLVKDFFFNQKMKLNNMHLQN